MAAERGEHDEAAPWVASLHALHHAAAVLTQTEDFSQLLDQVAEQVMRFVPYHTLRLFLVDEERHRLYPVAVHSVGEGVQTDELDDPRARLRLGEGVAGRIAQTGESEVIHDLQADPGAAGVPATAPDGESVLGVPLVYQGRTLGVLTVTAPGRSAFTASQQALLEVLGVSLAAAIGHQRALQAEQLAGGEAERLRTLQSTFVANVSHELRTPLTTIEGFLELALRRAREQHPDSTELESMLTAAQRGAKRLHNLVEDLLAIVVMETGRLQLAPESCSLPELVDEARREAGVAPDRLVTEGVEGVSLVADGQRVASLLAELLTNAVKYGPGGRPIRVRHVQETHDHVIDVIDEGEGIPEDHREEIFERFTQGDPSTTRAAGGTGIGLTLGRAIAEWHGGGLEYVPSSEGTTFRLRLPSQPVPRGDV